MHEHCKKNKILVKSNSVWYQNSYESLSLLHNSRAIHPLNVSKQFISFISYSGGEKLNFPANLIICMYLYLCIFVSTASDIYSSIASQFCFYLELAWVNLSRIYNKSNWKI